ncbi:MAG: alpha/beta hydrolase [Actinomycetota bacterium]|nr:alpha/beta hydrolase [Actinomycetota bacterium]
MATDSALIKAAALPNGLELPYVEQGDPSGVPVVFLHAFADSWHSFERVLPHLPRSIHAFAVTQRGHGDADRPASGYGVKEFTEDVVAFMDVVGLEAAVIVASSSASISVQRFAADHPMRTLGLVFIGAPRSLRDKPAVARFFDAVCELSDPIEAAFVQEFVEATVSRPLPPAFLETVIAENLKVPARVWRATLEGLLEAVPATETATITAPTLILWGDRDGFLPRSDQEALAAAIPGSRLVIFEGTGHVVHWEEPERVAADVVALAERVRPNWRRSADGN